MADESNWKVQPYHSVNLQGVGVFGPDAVLPGGSIEGGAEETGRLRRLGAIAPTAEEPTAFVPMAKSAVAEMSDDELTKENGRLKAELAKRDAGRREGDAELDRLRQQLAEFRKPEDLKPAAVKSAPAAADNPDATPSNLGPPVPGSHVLDAPKPKKG